MIDQITHLFRLQAIVEEGSMRKAADRLGVTQPALSRSIAQLEARFGKPLLVRSARGVVPTGYGRRVIGAISRLARQWQLSEADLLSDEAGTTGLLRVTAGPLWRAVVLPEVITRLQRQFAGVTVAIQNSAHPPTIADLAEGKVDAIFGGVQIADGQAPRLRRRQFTVVMDRVVAREDHPVLQGVEGGRLRDQERILDYPWIVYSPDPAYEFQTVHGKLERFGRAPDIRIRSESLISVIGFLQKGEYLCILPEAAVADVAGPRIVALPVDLGHRQIRSGVLFREEMADWPPMVQLLALCESYFDDRSARS